MLKLWKTTKKILPEKIISFDWNREHKHDLDSMTITTSHRIYSGSWLVWCVLDMDENGKLIKNPNHIISNTFHSFWQHQREVRFPGGKYI